MDIKQLNDEIDDDATDPLDRLLQDRKLAAPGRGIALLALLLALVAGAGTGWQWWQARAPMSDNTVNAETIVKLQASQQQLASTLASLESKLDAAGAAVSGDDVSRMAQRFSTVESQLDNMRQFSAEQQASMSAVQGGMRSLEQRLSVTESGLASVAANSQTGDVELDIAEIDFLLRAASERLVLFNDPEAADLALRSADVQIEALNDPMFLSVRQRIASARQALAAIPVVDRIQLSAELSGMQDNIPALAFRGERVIEPQADLPEDAGWWASLKHTLSSLVTVRRRVADDESPLTLEDKDYLRQGLWLQLESARLALMRSDAQTYVTSLDRVGDTLDRFFQGGAAPVQAILLKLSHLKKVEIAPEMPDISAPWKQLRQLRDSRRLLQSVSPPVARESVE